jgi:predicted acetyltransferase
VSYTIRLLTDDDREQAHRLSNLAFGGDLSAPMPTDPPPAGPRAGAFDDRGRLVAKAFARPYEQWWGGRPVPMAGIAGVAVAPEHRGKGLVRRLMDALIDTTEAPVSSLFPTAPSIYRPLDWEIVGGYDTTSLPLTWLPTKGPLEVRAASDDDLSQIEALYDARGASSSGLLVRRGESFPLGIKGVLEIDVVTVAIDAGRVVGYASYSRGRGYVNGGPLNLWDCIAQSPQAMQSLLAGLAGWSSVVDDVRWRGSTDDLALAVNRSLPPPVKAQPWMLRVLDPVAAVAQRGFAPGSTTASFAVADTGYRLEVADGRGQLTAVPADGLPVVQPRGLALLYAGVATGRLARNGLADRDLPELEKAFRGPRPEILDYF